MIRYLFRRLKRSERGASMVEFALVAPILILFLLGIIEFGWIFNGYITLTGSAREGARLAAVGKDDAEIRTAVKNHATTFTLSDSDIIIDPPTNQGYARKVKVTGEVNLLTGLLDSITLSAEATMRQEFSAAGFNGGGNPPGNGNGENGDPEPECLGPPDCRPPNNIHPDCPACNP